LPNRIEHITVFEHQALKVGKQNQSQLSNSQLLALQSYCGNGVPYFSLIHHGIQFNKYVGVIQVGNTLIEVLPKADRFTEDKTAWRNILIGMLKAVHQFDIRSTSQANLKIKPNSILDLYFELFVREVELILHQGLIKQYQQKESNTNSLKGKLLFAQHIQRNLVHQERFYSRFTTYSTNHPLNQVLYKTLKLVQQLNTHAGLQNRIENLLLNYPEMPDSSISEVFFSKLTYTKKNQHYKKSMELAKLLLLQFHPDISRGKNDVLALMFDMNKLWEQFVYVSLKRHQQSGETISSQTGKHFWQPKAGRKVSIRPDILITKNNSQRFVLDTKWKNLDNTRPSVEDLRQLFVYHEFYEATRVAIVYPGTQEIIDGNYFNERGSRSHKRCAVIPIHVNSNIKNWQEAIYKRINAWEIKQ
jgi:5-methylcytosine-specific restriction enzyme subunit McrC